MGAEKGRLIEIRVFFTEEQLGTADHRLSHRD